MGSRQQAAAAHGRASQLAVVVNVFPVQMASFLFSTEVNSSLAPYSPASSASPMSLGSDSPISCPSSPRHFSSQQPRYSNIYEERLRPLAPSSPLEEVRPMPRATHTKSHDPRLQDTLHNAVKNGDYQQLHSLLLASSERIDINGFNSEGQTPLQQACLSGQLALVQLMVRHGADPSRTSRDGWSTLHMAAFSGHSDITQFMLLCNRGR